MVINYNFQFPLEGGYGGNYGGYGGNYGGYGGNHGGYGGFGRHRRSTDDVPDLIADAQHHHGHHHHHHGKIININ